jgi:hypothetical protein
MKLRVQNFIYDGLFVRVRDGIADYTAEFKEWTKDPGIGKFECSDGKSRLIPSCCLKGREKNKLPEQDNSEVKKIVEEKRCIYVGVGSSSY